MNGFGSIRAVSLMWFINIKPRREVPAISLFRDFLNYKEIEYVQTNGSTALSEVDKCMSTCVFMASK